MHKQPGSQFRREFFGQLLGVGGTVALLSPGSSTAQNAPAPGLAINVRDCGAVGDGARLETQALQQAIDRCAQAGGGMVVVPAGRYLTGTLFLKTRVHLHLDTGAVLLGSPNLADYPVIVSKIRSYTDNYTEHSLLYAEGVEQVTISGRGVIDGQGASFKGPYKVRPYLVRFVGCRNVTVKDVSMVNSPMWVQHYLACEQVSIDGLYVASRCNANNDGVDIDGCRQVRISNCDISSGDDAIVLKSTLERPCQNVAITNCLLSSDCNAFKLGTESNGGFENIVLSNCVIYDTRLAGIAVEMVDGGRLERVNVSNVAMQNVNAPIFIRLGNRARPYKEDMEKPGQGSLREVSISHVQAVGANRMGCALSGLPEAFMEDISLTDIQLAFAGGGTEQEAARSVPENADKYPEYSMFGALPAYGIYCRHARGVRFENIRLSVGALDARPALLCEDVEDLEIFRFRGAPGNKPGPILQLKDVRDALVHACRCSEEAKTFARVSGKNSRRIKLFANHLGKNTKALEVGSEVDKDVVEMPKEQ